MKNNKKIFRISIFVIFVILVIIKVIPIMTLNIAYNKKNMNDNIDMKINYNYTILDLINYATLSNFNDEEINIEKLNQEKYTTNNQEFLIDIFLVKTNNNSKYTIEWGIGEEKNEEEIYNNKRIKIEFNIEGVNKYHIKVKRDGEIIKEYQDEVYFIKEYNKQFLDELEKKGIATHFAHGWDDIMHVDLLHYLGVKNIRDDIMITTIFKKDGTENYETYDKWIETVNKNNINLLGILNTNPKSGLFGSDGKVSDDEEVERFSNYALNIANRYPQIQKMEIINEPNGYYTSEEDLFWYTKLIEKVNSKFEENNKNIELLVGSTMTPDPKYDKRMQSEEFFNNIMKDSKIYKDSSYISFHLYDKSNSGLLNYRFKQVQLSHNELANNKGGFIKLAITEFGDTTVNIGSNINQQAYRFVQQMVLQDKLNNEINIVYNFKDAGTDITNGEDNYGIINNDYTPKPSYYAMKNYYENTNGSEYIGTVDIAEGLEAHVYNKDGKPKIIAWSNNSNKNIEIDYSDFTAKDIYGNNIENTNRKLTITTSPVYLDNISEKYYYLAISKTANEKYNEFENKYIEEIKAVTNLNTNIQTMKKYMTEVGNVTLGVPEDSAKKAIQQHYSLGKNILDAYKNGELKVEHVKLSSMLDSLEDIGNSYEDLVTVSSKTRNLDLDKANDQIKEVENIINSNTDLEIIYPSKILEFSKDYYEKATYINGLEEENDIKTGLIVSKNMHSIELSNWAKEFCEIYINEHIKNNPITTSYSQTEITNKDVQVTLNISEDCKINNNNGKKEYTFKENGEFTFEYTRRGKELSEKVVLNNIDKKSPEIKGVEQWKVYTKEVTPTVTDENLEKVELILNGQVVNGYIAGNEITEEGVYQIVATDKAGNISRVNFEVIEDIEKGYKIENGFIKNITGSTKRTDFENQLPIKYKYTIKREEKELDTNGIVATGDILETEGKEKYTLIVNGDINKDGIVSILDLVKIKRHILGEIKLEGIEKQAADANQDGKEIGIKDLVRMRILILSRGINN